MAAGARACDRLRELAPIVRKMADMARVIKKLWVVGVRH